MKPTVVQVKISEENVINFCPVCSLFITGWLTNELILLQVKYFKTLKDFLSYFQISKVGKIMSQVKYGHLTLPVVSPDKVIPDIDFTDEVVVHCDVPVVEILL